MPYGAILKLRITDIKNSRFVKKFAEINNKLKI